MPDNRADTPYVFESEVLSPYARLQPGESFTWRYEWTACRIGGDFPVLRCSKAGLVSEPLDCQRDGGRVQLRGRFGVFHLGRLLLEVYDEKGELLEVDILDTNATPTRPVVLNRALKLPSAAHRLVVVLQDEHGVRIGEVAHVVLVWAKACFHRNQGHRPLVFCTSRKRPHPPCVDGVFLIGVATSS
jgi:hypothetical protein